MTHILRRRQVLRAPLREVFAFHTDPRNLEAITPPWLGFRVVSSSDRAVRRDTRIAYRLRLHGIPMRWVSRIAEYEEGALFADEMLAGPYARWYHRHHFTAVDGGVAVEDIVEYTLPLGPIGRAVHALVVRRQLDRIFDYRAAALARVFAGSPAAGDAISRSAARKASTSFTTST